MHSDHQNKLATQGYFNSFEYVCMLLVLSIVNVIETRQVNYVNIFAQANLTNNVFTEKPTGFKHYNNDGIFVL